VNKTIFEMNEEIISEASKLKLKEIYKANKQDGINTKLKIVFMGTPDFAVPIFQSIDDIFGVDLVVTIPDKPQGRGLKLTPSEVKIEAEQRQIEILQPENLKDETFIQQIKNLNPDIICVVAFKILPKEIFELAQIATFNIHGSLLPKFRGAAPINRAIVDGESITGLTSFILNNKVDTGNILLQCKTQITETTIASELYDDLKVKASDLAIVTIQLLLNGNYTAINQNDELATKAPKVFANDSFIDWNNTKDKTRCFINGLSYFPGARTYLDGKLLKIFRAKNVEQSQDFANNEELSNGEIVINHKKLYVKCQDGLLEILELQLEGKKKMQTSDFVMGIKTKERIYLNNSK